MRPRTTLPGAFVAVGVLLVIVQSLIGLHGCYKGDPGYGLPPLGPDDAKGIVEFSTCDAARPLRD